MPVPAVPGAAREPGGQPPATGAGRPEVGGAQLDGQERPLGVGMVRTSWSRIIAHVGEQVIEGSEGDLLDIIRFVVDLIEKQL